MANQSLVLCDTNILIEFYRGNEAILANLKEIGQKNIAISAVTAGELIYGALNKTTFNSYLSIKPSAVYT
jgi:tRNA(fMet)-specific endonuclease VapC